MFWPSKLHFVQYINVYYGVFLLILQYLQGLEDSLKQFNDQNRKLQEENEILKRKLMSLQEEVKRVFYIYIFTHVHIIHVYCTWINLYNYYCNLSLINDQLQIIDLSNQSIELVMVCFTNPLNWWWLVSPIHWTGDGLFHQYIKLVMAYFIKSIKLVMVCFTNPYNWWWFVPQQLTASCQ